MIVWLASFPRSGNTLLRMLIWQRFGGALEAYGYEHH